MGRRERKSKTFKGFAFRSNAPKAIFRAARRKVPEGAPAFFRKCSVFKSRAAHSRLSEDMRLRCSRLA